MDIKISNATVITNNTNDDVLDNAQIHIKDGRIAYVGPAADAPVFAVQREIEADGNIVMPGFFDLHTHIPMTILRGYADDLPLDKWLFERIFPAEDKLDDEMVYWSSLAALCEFAAAGIVGFNEMYSNHDAIADAAIKSGHRMVLARGIVSPDHEGTELRMREARECFEKYHGEGRCQVFMAPHAQYTVNEQTLKRIADMAKECGVGIHVHVSETKSEHDNCVKETGKTPIQLFESLGLLDVPFIGAHCVWVSDDDIKILAAHGATVASCPRSNLKLASGIAPVKKMIDAGVNVALGTDGAASNNKLSMMSEMTFASMLQKGVTGDPEAVPAKQAIRMASAHGAGALGFDSGVIEAGKNADIIMFNSHGVRFRPKYDPVSSVVYAASDTDICMTMVGGDVIYENGKVTFVDIEEVYDRLEKYSAIYKG